MTIEERKEAAKWFQNRARHTPMQGAKMMFERAAEALSEGMQPHWIPCSERLPKVFNVLCCDVNGDIIIAYPSNDDDSDTGFSAESESEYMPNVVAWMPLPEPYGGESE